MPRNIEKAYDNLNSYTLNSIPCHFNNNRTLALKSQVNDFNVYSTRNIQINFIVFYLLLWN